MENKEVVKNISEHLAEIMKLLEIPITDSNKDTNTRVAKMWVNELFANRNNRNIEELDAKMKVFDNDYGNDVIVMKDIEFNSMCEHHWLPFSGKVTVAYVPNKKVIGLSKIPRVVKYFSKQPTLQEKLGKDVGDYLFKTIQPLMLIVVIKSTHSCVKCRGAESDCETNTQYSVYDTSLLDKEQLRELNNLIMQRVGVM